MSLYEELQTGTTGERQAIATQLIEDMQMPGRTANLAYWNVCQRVIAQAGAAETAADAALPDWEFTADNSALLVARHTRRVQGFLGAIARAPQAETIIDAGCGSSALLAVGAAATHPKAEIQAYEINESAADCARTVIDIMGFSDRISVTTADVLKTELPTADLGVTETFAIGLLTEQGHHITRQLAQTCREILPTSATLYACDERPTANTFWQPAAAVDFQEGTDDQIKGHLRAKGAGMRPVHVYAAFFDARNQSIVTEVGTNLTNPVELGRVPVPKADTTIGFAYMQGTELHENPPKLWLEPR
jgi:hypothetical protein